MLIIAIIFAKNCKQSRCSWKDKRINELWYTCKMEYCLQIRNNELLIHKITWMNLKCILLSVEISPNFFVLQQMPSDRTTKYIQLKQSCVSQCQFTIFPRTFLSDLFYFLVLFTFSKLGGVGRGECGGKDCETDGNFTWSFRSFLEYVF